MLKGGRWWVIEESFGGKECTFIYQSVVSGNPWCSLLRQRSRVVCR